MVTKTENNQTTIFDAKFHFIHGKCHIYVIDKLFYFIPTSQIKEDKDGNIIIPEWLYKKLKPSTQYIW